MFSELFDNVPYIDIFIAAFLFLMGIYLAPTIVEKDIKWLLKYPRWVGRLIQKYFSARWGFLTLFVIILVLNNLSLFFGFVSGFIIILPYLIAFLTGFHVAVVGYDLMSWQGIWHLLVNPVAWLEFPAAWISFGMGIHLSNTIITAKNFDEALRLFEQLLPIYIKYVFILLTVAALLESLLIRWAEKFKNDSNS
jgi:hypothetical protein